MTGSRRCIHQGQVVNLGMETADLPDGREIELEVVRHPGGAAIVAVNDRQQVCLLRQYRHATGGWLWELPAGKLEAGESAAQTAQRELQEEAGLQAQGWLDLGKVFTTPGFCDEVIHLFIAHQLQPVPHQHQVDELIEIHWLDFSEALAWVMNGTINDAKTALGLLRAQQTQISSGQAETRHDVL